jgi:hypothetical protein
MSSLKRAPQGGGQAKKPADAAVAPAAGRAAGAFSALAKAGEADDVQDVDVAPVVSGNQCVLKLG